MKPPDLAPDSALFLDFDGTLVDIAPTPDSVHVPSDLANTLSRLSEQLNGALCVVSGRTLKELQAFLSPADLNFAGEHGAAIAAAGAERTEPPRFWPPAWNEPLDAFAARHPGTLIERKSRSVAIHFRLAPAAAEDALSLATKLAHDKSAHYEVLPAKMAFEVKQAAMDKGKAVDIFMKRPPFLKRIPIFVGDDVTDEGGFDAAEKLGGLGLHVETAFDNSPANVRAWLKGQIREGAEKQHDAA